jgi:hypothetical protein
MSTAPLENPFGSSFRRRRPWSAVSFLSRAMVAFASTSCAIRLSRDVLGPGVAVSEDASFWSVYGPLSRDFSDFDEMSSVPFARGV